MAQFKSRKSIESAKITADGRPPRAAVIPVNWIIPSVKDLLTCKSDLFHHESLPGISWQFFFELDDEFPDFVCVCLQPAMSPNKGKATVVSAGFNVLLASLEKDTHKKFAAKANLFVVRKGTYVSKSLSVLNELQNLFFGVGALILSGQITVKLPSGSAALRKIYDDGRFSDLTIKTEHETFKVHKNVLAATCPAILNLLPGPEAVSVNVDSTTEAVMAMLQFLYDDPLSFGDLVDLSCEVLVLAEFMKLGSLKKICEDALIDQLWSTNVFTLVAFASSANSDLLKNKAYEFAVDNIDSLDLDHSWVSLKAEHPTTAISLGEYVTRAVSRKAAGQAKENAALPDLAKVVSGAVALEIPVRWEISDFQNLMENSKCGFSITCKEKFSHESTPGITWELIMYPNGKLDYSHHVALFMRPILTSGKKSQATAPSGGYSLRFEPTVNANDTSVPPPEQILPVQQFSLKSELGIAQFAHQPLIDKHCFTRDKSVALVGKILIEPPASKQTLRSRKSFETGARSDFKIEVDGMSFPVHTLILADASPAMQAMFDMQCKESDTDSVVIKETTVEAVRALLQFWYGDPLCFDGLEELSMDVHKLTNRYQDFELRQICEDALLRMASTENVVHLAAFAADQHCESLEKAALKIIFQDPDVFEQDAWSQLKDANFKLALTILEGIITNHCKSFR